MEALTSQEFAPFIVCFSGEKEVAERVSAWAAAQIYPILHVSSVDALGTCSPDDFNDERLRAYCVDVLEKRASDFTQDRLDAARSSLSHWIDHEPAPAGLKEYKHNITLPSHMSLLRAARSLEEGNAFIGSSEAEYTTIILESIKAVLAVRMHVGLRPFHDMTLINPPLILAEPAFYRHAYRRTKPEGPFADAVVMKTLRMLQTQKTLCNETSEEFVKELQESPASQPQKASA